MSLKRWIPIATLSLLLASCFTSSKPLFSEKDADYPIISGTHFKMQRLNAEGKPDSAAPHDVTLTRDGAFYVYSETGEEPMKGLLDDLGNGNYAAITESDDGLLYGLFQKRGDKWLRHGVNCPDFEKLAGEHGKTLADFGIEKRSSDCGFSTYADLKRALAFEAEFGKPDAVYMPVK